MKLPKARTRLDDTPSMAEPLSSRLSARETRHAKSLWAAAGLWLFWLLFVICVLCLLWGCCESVFSSGSIDSSFLIWIYPKLAEMSQFNSMIIRNSECFFNQWNLTGILLLDSQPFHVRNMVAFGFSLSQELDSQEPFTPTQRCHVQTLIRAARPHWIQPDWIQ